MCIYYRDRIDLNYKSQEHVIPAAIGGILKLPLGFVSDEFNTDFSSLEGELIKTSLVSIPREIEGPGKRGKLADKYATKSKVVLMQDTNDESRFSLGYIKKGKSIEIPSLSINETTGKLLISYDTSDLDFSFDRFSKSLLDQTDENIRTITSDNLPIDLILIGVDEPIENNVTCFVAKNSNNNFQINSLKIKDIASHLNFNESTKKKRSYDAIINQSIRFNIEHLRVFAKIAFNYLAYLKGYDFVKLSQFESISNYVAKGGQNKFVTFNTTNRIFDKIDIKFPESAHLVFINKIDSYLVSTVHLYKSIAINVILSDCFFDSFKMEGMVCDWKNRKEYTFEEYITRFFHENSIFL